MVFRFFKWEIVITFGSWDRYAIIPYIEYAPSPTMKRILFCFWKWNMVIDVEKIEKGGEK